MKQAKLYYPKYLAFFTQRPFFISFKYMLQEIYDQSCKTDLAMKTENILTTLLFRLYLPKYETTQLLFCMNTRVYSFVNQLLQTEISLKLLFTILSIDKIVLIFVSLLMNSSVIFFHSKYYILFNS